jgi:uncharacterized protein (DUF4415 family)
MMKKERIVSYTAEELDAMESKTDWAKVDAMTNEELEAIIAADPDNEGAYADWSRITVGNHQRLAKGMTTIRLDRDVMEWFRAKGKGWQTRINAVLKAYVEHEKRAGRE